MVYICPGGNCTGIAIFFFDKVSHLKHPNVHRQTGIRPRHCRREIAHLGCRRGNLHGKPGKQGQEISTWNCRGSSSCWCHNQAKLQVDVAKGNWAFPCRLQVCHSCGGASSLIVLHQLPQNWTNTNCSKFFLRIGHSPPSRRLKLYLPMNWTTKTYLTIVKKKHECKIDWNAT